MRVVRSSQTRVILITTCARNDVANMLEETMEQDSSVKQVHEDRECLAVIGYLAFTGMEHSGRSLSQTSNWINLCVAHQAKHAQGLAFKSDLD